MIKWRMGLHSVKNKIWLETPFDPTKKINEDLKAGTQGCRWDTKDKFWLFPLDIDVARDIVKIAKEHGASIRVEPELATWVKKEKEKFKQIIMPDDLQADMSGLLPRLRSERPDIISAMEKNPWQLSGAGFILQQKRVLNADDPGLGKTLQTLAAIAESDIRGAVIVIAPKSAVAITWPDEIKQWLGEEELVIKINTELSTEERTAFVNAVRKRIQSNPEDRIWVVCGPNYLRIRAELDQYGKYIRDDRGRKLIYSVNESVPELFDIEWSAVIVDESHQTLAISRGDKKKWSAQRLGLDALPVSPGGFRIAMSGTPFRGKTENMWGTLQWLHPKKYTSIWNWNRRHYGVIDQRAIGGAKYVKGDSVLDEEKFFKELRPIIIRRTKAEVAPWLPPKQYGGTHLVPTDDSTPKAVWLPLSKKQKKQYNDIVKNAMLYLDVDELTVNGVLAEMIRFKQIANSCLASGRWDDEPECSMPSNKVDWITDFIYERRTAGTKVIVASQFTKFLNMLSVHLKLKKFGHYLFTGQTSDNERVRIKREFQKPEGEMVILLNTIAGGTSLTLDLADDVVVCDQTWSPDDQTQVEDRAHRMSRIHNVTIWNLASLETIDEDMAILNQQRKKQTSLIDTQRDIYVRKLVEMTKNRAS
jgi:SNF2 family DNA or RNA helicase